MPVRHYSLDYSITDGASWIPAVADETPGPDKTLAISGLTPATYSVKLRLNPLTGDPTPIVSEAVVLNLGNAPIVEPVQSSAVSVVTVAELIIRRDNLLAAAGVVVSQEDLLTMNEALLSSATVVDSVVDNQFSGFQEPVVTVADVVATVADVQMMLEQVLAAVNAVATVADTYTPGASVPAQVTLGTVSNSPAQITVPWTDVTGETSYELFYADTTASVAGTLLTATGYGVGDTAYPGTPNATAGKITGIAANQVSYLLSGMLTQGVTYYVKVAGRNASGLGALSAAGSAVAAAVPAAFGALAPNDPSFTANNALTDTTGYTDNAWSKYTSATGSDPVAIATVLNVAISGQDTTDLDGTRAIQMTVASGFDGEAVTEGHAELKYKFTGLDGTKSKLFFTVKQKTAWQGSSLGFFFVAYNNGGIIYQQNETNTIPHTGFFTSGADEYYQDCTIDLDAIKFSTGGTNWSEVDEIRIRFQLTNDVSEVPTIILIDDFRSAL